MRIKALVAAIVMVWGLCSVSENVLALDYPTREIDFIAPFGAGSTSDLFGRLATSQAEKYVGKPFVTTNQTGGGGARAFTLLANGKPDGYTIGLLSNSVIGQTYLLKGVTFHYKTSFRLIAQINYSPYAFVVKKGGPYDVPIKELVKMAKEKPITFGIGGAKWSVYDFARAIFEEETGVKFVVTPFPTASELNPFLLGGHVGIGICSPGQWLPLYQAGLISVLVISTDQRDPLFPNVPTFKELGYDVGIRSYHWIAAPPKTPDPIINFLADAFKKAFAEPSFKEACERLGGKEDWQGPEGALKSMETVGQLYQKVIKKYDLKPQ
jgi:tripartite-type tricarboxylate transporter receptor subunit TctC